MRHVYTNRVVVLIVSLLTCAAVLIAWARSRPSAPPADPRPTTVTSGTSAWLEAGRRVYERNCAACHRPDEPGRTVPRALADRANLLVQAQGGREYLANLLLYGATGEIRVDGRERRLRHAAYGGLSDAELAALLNVLVLDPGGNDSGRPFPPYTADEVRSLRRSASPTPDQVLESRPVLRP